MSFSTVAIVPSLTFLTLARCTIHFIFEIGSHVVQVGLKIDNVAKGILALLILLLLILDYWDYMHTLFLGLYSALCILMLTYQLSYILSPFTVLLKIICRRRNKS